MISGVRETEVELKRRGVRTIFNLHPAYGVQYFDATYEALARALEIAESWAQGPSIAFALAKRQVWASLNVTLPEALRFEQDSRFLTYQTHDRIEGRTAFQEKRPPKFEGR